MKRRAHRGSEDGQAIMEYFIALFIGLVIVLALGLLYRTYSAGGMRPDSSTDKTFQHAPYSLPNNGRGSMQWTKDLLMH